MANSSEINHIIELQKLSEMLATKRNESEAFKFFSDMLNNFIKFFVNWSSNICKYLLKENEHESIDNVFFGNENASINHFDVKNASDDEDSEDSFDEFNNESDSEKDIKNYFHVENESDEDSNESDSEKDIKNYFHVENESDEDEE